MAARAAPAPLAQLPNALTVVRLALIPIFVVLVLGSDEGHSWPAALVFAAAGITDQVDGWLARRWQVESEFGRYFDPLADRLMIDAAVVMLWLEGRLPGIALAVILVRDGLLVLATPAATRRGYEFSVNFLGKAATWGLYASLAFVLATRDGTDWPLWLFWASVGVALAAGGAYAAAVWKAVRR